MTIEKRRNAIADKTAPSQAPRVPAVERPGGGPKLPGPPGVPGTERFRLPTKIEGAWQVLVTTNPGAGLHLTGALYEHGAAATNNTTADDQLMLLSLLARPDLLPDPGPAGGDGQRIGHPARGQGTLVLPWPAGDPQLLQRHRGWCPRPDALPGRAGHHPVHRPVAVQGGA